VVAGAGDEAMFVKLAARLLKVLPVPGVSRSSDDITSPTVLAHRTLTDLEAMHALVKVEDTDGAAVLSDGQQATVVTDGTDEKQIVRMLTPFFSDALAEATASVSASAATSTTTAAATSADASSALPLVLVNSEQRTWLDHLRPVTAKFHLKPDLFVSWEPFVRFEAAKGGQGTGDEYLFGGLADPALQRDGCVPIILEGKHVPLGNVEFADMVVYHGQLPGLVHGVLFNATHFMLTKAVSGRIFHVTKGRWTQGGTRQLLQKHFADALNNPPLIVEVLGKLLAKLNLITMRRDNSAFLGAGAFGRVFLVREPEGSVRALKVVATESTSISLVDDFNALDLAATLDAPVVNVVQDSLRMHDKFCGGYAMKHVGTPFKTLTKDVLLRIFSSLLALHKAGILHGDARLPNVVNVDDSPRWVDLVNSHFSHQSFPAHARADMRTLAASVLGLKSLDDLPTPLYSAIAAYDITAETAAAVAKVVWTMKN